MESEAHIQLKRVAVAFLLRHGFAAAACEVALPIPRWRADAAGYLDRRPAGPEVNHFPPPMPRQPDLPFGGGSGRATPDEPPHSARPACEPRTAIIECKQSREDFLRHNDRAERLIGLRTTLERRRRAIEDHHLRQAEPHLRAAPAGHTAALFADGEHWDFSAAEHPGYRKVIRLLDRVDTRLHGGTKFATVARYRLADWLYVVAPRGVVGLREIPPGWGLVEVSPKWSTLRRMTVRELTEIEVAVTHPAPELAATAARRSRLLRNIAAAATREAAER
ncbi:MAG: hypothetical protein IBJ11_02910 [Phycisphaerales bacterium]|nr:hypothetical protein [Phycisphaerales bacterium]